MAIQFVILIIILILIILIVALCFKKKPSRNLTAPKRITVRKRKKKM